MVDAIFAHPRLAPVYDTFDGSRDDLAAYLSIAGELGADRVLDVGCGTGCLAMLLAESGRTVVGVDPAEASLEVARAKDTTGRITWVQGDATSVPALGADVLGADLAVMTGNVAQVFLTDADWGQALAGIHAALRPGGYLVFETRRPDQRAWEDWAADGGWDAREVPGTGWVERRLEVTEVSLPFVSFRNTYRFLADGAVVTSDSTLRFRRRDEVESSLIAHGYRVLDVREAPDRPRRELVFVAERTTRPGTPRPTTLPGPSHRNRLSAGPRSQVQDHGREAGRIVAPAPTRPPAGTSGRAYRGPTAPTMRKVGPQHSPSRGLKGSAPGECGRKTPPILAPVTRRGSSLRARGARCRAWLADVRASGPKDASIEARTALTSIPMTASASRSRSPNRAAPARRATSASTRPGVTPCSRRTAPAGWFAAARASRKCSLPR